jgi:hypothetical protein
MRGRTGFLVEVGVVWFAGISAGDPLREVAEARSDRISRWGWRGLVR